MYKEVYVTYWYLYIALALTREFRDLPRKHEYTYNVYAKVHW